MEKTTAQKNENLFKNLNIAFSLGFTIALPAVFFVFIGVFLDKLLHTSPILTIIFILLGIVVGALSAMREIKKII